MTEVKELNLTEILTALQDFMTSDGSISQEQREFYSVFRQYLNEHEGEFKVEDIERLLMAAKADVPDLTEEEFFKMGEAILTRYRNKNEDAINERIRALAAEEAVGLGVRDGVGGAEKMELILARSGRVALRPPMSHRT